MPTVAVIGSTGQLGSDLVIALQRGGSYEVVPLSHREIEITDPVQVQEVLASAHADVVVNCAAFVHVDRCEDYPEVAFRVNALGALHTARSCRATGALCVYVSTDFVFGGGKGMPYTEEDRPSPINVYGATKLAGEYLVMQSCPRYLILRTASLFGRSGPRGKGSNFVEAVLAQAQAGQRLRVIDDVRMSPTYTGDAARAIVRLLDRDVEGVIHLTNAGSCTWYEFAQAILKTTGRVAAVEPVRAADYPVKARRPMNSSLASTRLSEVLGVELRPWSDALHAYLHENGRFGV